MGFAEAVTTCLKLKFITISGRAPRSEYWYFLLFQMTVYVLLFALLLLVTSFGDMIYGSFSTGGWIVLGLIAIFFLGTVIPAITVTVRRLHDRNLSGWWYLAFVAVSFVPILDWISSIVLLVVMCLKGTDGDNKYGPDPLTGPDHARIFA